jgi:hypothetical protein
MKTAIFLLTIIMNFVTEAWEMEISYIRRYQPMVRGWLGTKAAVSVSSPELIEVGPITLATTVALAKS